MCYLIPLLKKKVYCNFLIVIVIPAKAFRVQIAHVHDWHLRNLRSLSE